MNRNIELELYIKTYLFLLYKHTFYTSIPFLSGRGKPSIIKTESNVLIPLQEEEIPTTQEAVEIYQQIYEGALTLESPFGDDPLADHAELKEMREHEFDQRYLVDEIFSGCVNDMSQQFQDAIIWYCERTLQLSLLL